MALDTCALYGTSNYANGWIGINLLVILASLTFIAFVYVLSGFFPTRTRSKLVEAIRSEYTQMLLSAVIIAVLAGAAHLVCGISASYSMSFANTALSPFQYANFYIGNLSTNTGISLLINLYSTSVAYEIEAQTIESVGNLTSQFIGGTSGSILAGVIPLYGVAGGTAGLLGGVSAAAKASPAAAKASPVAVKASPVAIRLSLPAMSAWSQVFSSLAGWYAGVFATLVTLAVGTAFLQYILILVIQSVAFTVVLPIAILMRSIAFAGTGLRQSANSVLAIAIAAYLVYPLTIAFDTTMMHYALSNSGQAPALQQINVNSFFSSTNGGLVGAVGLVWHSLPNLVVPLPNTVLNQTLDIVDKMAQFLFKSIVLFALNLAITIGFAVSVAKALNAGVEGAGSFWSNI